MYAKARHIRISPKKANIAAALVRNKDVNEALDILKFTPKKSAKLLYTVLTSAIANAENNFKQNKSSLYISEVLVSKAETLHRRIPISRGRAHPIKKIMSHISITLDAKKAGSIATEDKTKKVDSEEKEKK